MPPLVCLYPLLALLVLGVTLCVASAQAAIYHLSPQGSDASPGTAASPWKTFQHALPQLRPGDTLLLQRGTYTRTTTGVLTVPCGGAIAQGTPQQPITVMAAQERQALIKGDGGGSSRPIHITNCRSWVFAGLRAENGDFPGERSGSEAGAVAVVQGSQDITLRRLLLRYPNRHQNVPVLMIRESQKSLVEESEIYAYHRHGFTVRQSSQITFRRNYANSQGYGDLAGGYRSANNQTDRGDSGFAIYTGNRTAGIRYENNISEGNGKGYLLKATYTDIDDTVLTGNISLQDTWGLDLQGGASHMTRRTAISDFVVWEPRSAGILFASAQDATCTRCTIAHAGREGVLAYQLGSGRGDGRYSFTATGLLVLGSQQAGVAVARTFGSHWTINGANAWQNAPNYSLGSGGTVRGQQSVDPQLGDCRVWVPSQSPLAQAGIGARIVLRTVNGVLTQTPLWDPATGQFPCGAVIPGVNDASGASCHTVHERLHVGRGGCAVSGSTLPPALSVPTHLRLLQTSE